MKGSNVVYANLFNAKFYTVEKFTLGHVAAPFLSGLLNLRLVPLPDVSVDCLMYRPSPAMKRKKCFVFF